MRCLLNTAELKLIMLVTMETGYMWWNKLKVQTNRTVTPCILFKLTNNYWWMVMYLMSNGCAQEDFCKSKSISIVFCVAKDKMFQISGWCHAVRWISVATEELSEKQTTQEMSTCSKRRENKTNITYKKGSSVMVAFNTSVICKMLQIKQQKGTMFE